MKLEFVLHFDYMSSNSRLVLLVLQGKLTHVVLTIYVVLIAHYR